MTGRSKLGLGFAMGALLLSVCTATAADVAPVKPSEKNTMQLTSNAFKEGQPIPVQHTCDGKDLSPPLKWTGAPPGTKSFALIVDDPDAPVGTWVHWVLYDVPGNATELSEGVPKTQYVAGNAKQGMNDFKHLGYGGPCPPPGKAHRYFFKLYALDHVIGIKPGTTKKDVEAAMQTHVLAQSQLMGTYQR
jgi:Raf kinase inhibitor-like YbhB/YbcL family protein